MSKQKKLTNQLSNKQTIELTNLLINQTSQIKRLDASSRCACHEGVSERQLNCVLCSHVLQQVRIDVSSLMVLDYQRVEMKRE